MNDLFEGADRRTYPDDFDVGPVDAPYQRARRIESLRELERQYHREIAAGNHPSKVKFYRNLQDQLVRMFRGKAPTP